MGPNSWGIFLILPVTTGEGTGPDGEISPVVCMLKNGLVIPLSKNYSLEASKGMTHSLNLVSFTVYSLSLQATKILPTSFQP